VSDDENINGEAASSSEPIGVAVSGVVKWFDPVKGFGFVLADEGGSDILLHVNVLRNYGQSSVADGARIDLFAQETSRGIQATSITAIHPPEGAQSVALADIVGMPADDVAAAPLEPARVKWFDKSKGFGFANVFGKREDVFLHIEVLRQSGLSDLQPGEALAMRVIKGKRGNMAAEVQAWEMVELDNDG
jgi:CspA family cold shock protein